MGRPRTATAILELKGSFKKDPQRKRVDPKSAGEIGDAPGYFAKDVLLGMIWDELVADSPVGVLTAADRTVLALACHMELRVRLYGIGGSGGGISVAEASLLASLMGKLGCTPSDRAKVAVAPSKAIDNDPLSEFMN